MTPLHNENTNTSPQGTARSRQHSTNSLFAKATSSPSRKALYNIDGTYKTSGKNSSPHGGAAGASEWHLRSPSSRSGPLAPLGAIANAQATYRQPAQNKVLLATPSSHSILQGPGSKADGLRLHWDDVATSNARQRATSQSQSSSARNSFEQNSQSRHQFASLTARDLSIPDLQDADVSPLDSHFLLSPFTMSEPNFSKSPARNTSLEEKPSPPPVSSQVPSPPNCISQAANTATPTSPPRQPFFQTGSAGSFSRFPTPDKLALGFTPSPVQQGNLSPSGLLLPPISPSGPILADDSSLLRSASSQTIQSDCSSTGSFNTSSSTSGLSDIVRSDLAASGPTRPSKHEAKPSRSKTKGGALSRSDIRESLLSFPSPPTSPRLFTFGKAGGTFLSGDDTRETPHTSDRSVSMAQALQVEAITETDDLQSSIDELLAGTRTSDASALPSKAEFPMSNSSSASMPPGCLPRARDPRRLPSASLPPNMALPPLPPLSKLSLGKGDSPSQEIPGSGEVSLAASYIRPILPLRTPQMAANPAFENRQSPTQAAAGGSATIRAKASNPQTATPVRTLRPSKSTESFLASKGSSIPSDQRPPLPTMASQVDTPKQSRRRRASLSIKIPKMFTKARKADEDLLPQSAISQNSLQIPQSRFSPDSDGPTPISEKMPANIFRRLSRAASSPNLKANPAMEGGVLRQSSRKAQFVAPASAPPVPTASVLPSQGDTSSGTPLPTPSLLTDIDSSMGGDSPRPGGSAEHDSTFARMQNYNPYFPKFPPRQSSLVLSPTALQDGRGPQSPHDMDWLHSPPHNTLSKPAPPVDVSALQIKPVIALAMPDSSNSDSGSASMPSENPAKSTKTSTAQRSTGTRRSTPAGSSNGDDEEDEEDAYGGQSLSSDEYYTSSEDDGDVDEESEDDDVPLAETHPDALDVQKSLRAKVKRDQAKKKKRTIKAGEPKDVAIQDQQIPHREVQNPQNIPLDRALSKKATMSQTSAQAANKRNPFGFAPDELSEKLRHLDASHGRLNSLCHPPKRPDSAGERPHDLLLPQTDEHIKLRNSTKGRTNLAPPLAPFVQDSVLTMSEGSESEDVAPLRIKKKSQTTPLPPSVPSSHTMARHAHSEAPSIPASPKSPSLKQIDQSFSSLHENTNDHRSAAPGHQHHHHHGRPSFRSVQRVYINDPQHHCSVEVDENMTAAMLLAHLRAKGAISSNPAWSVTEVWRAMGVERPLREYELLQESIESWSSEANSSLLLVKKSPLAPLLSSLSKMRSDSETTGGWAYLEVKHGKWSKRYLEVRNGAMYIGKSEKQRDLALLCHFSNFDAYIVPQACLAKMKTPKPFAFAVKSVDKVSLFENADQDYIHFFSVKTEAERDMWIQHILECRSKLVKQIVASRAAAQGHDTRSNLMGQQMMQQHYHQQLAVQQGPQHHSMPMNTSSSMSRSGSSKSHTPPMPSQAVFGDQSLLARRPANAHPLPMEAKKIISADNLPPLPGAIPSGTFATLPQGRQWERLAPEDKRAMIHEASRKARDGGKALLDFGETQESAGLLGRARAKSVGQRR